MKKGMLILFTALIAIATLTFVNKANAASCGNYAGCCRCQ